MKDTSLARVGGISGFIIAALSIIYAVAFLIVTPAEQRGSDLTAFYSSFAANPTGRQLANLCFVLSGILGPFVVVAVSERLRGHSEGWARWSLVVGTLAIVATGIHGFYNLIVTPIQANLYNSGDAMTRAAIAVARRCQPTRSSSSHSRSPAYGRWSSGCSSCAAPICRAGSAMSRSSPASI